MHCRNTRPLSNSQDEAISAQKESTYQTAPQPVVTSSLCPSLSVAIMPFRQFIRRLLTRNEQGPRQTTRRDGDIISTFVGGPSEPQHNSTLLNPELGEEITPFRWFSAHPTGWWEQRLGDGDNNNTYVWRPGLWPATNSDRGAHRGSPVYSQRRLQGVRLTTVNYASIEEFGAGAPALYGSIYGDVASWERSFYIHDSNLRLTAGNRVRREDTHHTIDIRTEHETNIPARLLLAAVLAAIRIERATRLLLPENSEYTPEGSIIWEDDYNEGRPFENEVPQNTITRRHSV